MNPAGGGVTNVESAHDIITLRYTVIMPLIPGFKGAVAKYCARDAKQPITGFIRWQGMDTIYSIRSVPFQTYTQYAIAYLCVCRIDCCFQGRRCVVAGLEEQMLLLATQICESRTDGAITCPIMEVILTTRVNPLAAQAITTVFRWFRPL